MIHQEEPLFKAGITALQAGRTEQARASFQSAIDAGVATGRSYLGLALACLSQSDLPAAEAALDNTLKLEPANLRALIMKGDIVFARTDNQAAAAHYGLALRIAARQQGLPEPLKQDLNRISARQQQLMHIFREYLMECLATAGYLRSTASERFNASLDMMLGQLERPEDTSAFPQAPHVYYLPELDYHTFYPEQRLPWLAKLEYNTDVIALELQTLLSAESETFSPYIHSGIDRPQQGETALLDSRDWTSAYLWEDGKPNASNMTACPETTRLMQELPLTLIEGFAPSVLFSKLDAGARIEPHTGMLNARLICHLPLVVPDNCALRVGADTRVTERGRAWAFDDSINHEAWNESGSERVILLFDVWRPDVREDERHYIKALLEAVSSYQNNSV